MGTDREAAVMKHSEYSVYSGISSITPVYEGQRVIREGVALLSPLLIKRHEKKMNNYIFRLRGLRQ